MFEFIAIISFLVAAACGEDSLGLAAVLLLVSFGSGFLAKKVTK